MRFPKLDLVMYICNRWIGQLPSHTIRLGFYRNIMQFEIAKSSFIFMGALFDCPRGLTIGPHSIVNDNCRLDTRGGLEIGTNVSVSSQVTILTADHDVRCPKFSGRRAKVTLNDYVFVGARALILPGVTIGYGAAVAAGAVVSRDVPEFSIVAGVPAKQIGERPKEFEYEINYGRLFC